MEEKQVMINILTKYFNKTEEEIKELIYEEDENGEVAIKENAADALIQLDTNRIERIRKEIGEKTKNKFDDFAKKTKREVLTSLESELKEQYGVESDKTGAELIADIVEKHKGSVDITEETIKTNPIFLKLEKATKERYETELSEVKTEFEQFKENVERSKKMNAVRGRARNIFLSLNPALSENKERAEIQINDFLEKLDNYDYELIDDTIIVKRNGERIEDGHSNPVAFDKFITGEAEKRFDFLEQERRDAPGNKNTPGGAGKKKISKEEYNEMMGRAHTDEAVKEIIDNYEVV